MIVLDGVSFQYPFSGKKVLDDISLSIEEGEWISIVGGNASGKSTLARIIAGLLEPDEGAVLIDGRPVSQALRDFSKVPPLTSTFQNPDGFFVTSSVSEEIVFGMENVAFSPSTIGERFRKAVEIFDLSKVLSRNPHLLSGGEKQRVALASAWALGARCVILDEPLSFLDSISADRFLGSFEDAFRGERTAVIWMALSDGEFPLAERVLHLEGGNLVEGHEEAETESRHGEICRKADVPSDVGHNPTTGGKMLEVSNALFSYTGASFKLSVPCLDLSGGECLGVCGVNGSGKSTLLLGCSGLLPPEAGTVRLMGKEMRGRKDFPQGEVGFVFQIPEESFFKSTVYEEVSFGLRNKGPAESVEGAVRTALSTAGLEPGRYMYRNPYSLSQGERRLVAMASILALDAGMYFFDEPLIFLDRSARRRVVDLLVELRKRGKGVVVASHDSSFLKRIADRIVTCSDGVVR